MLPEIPPPFSTECPIYSDTIEDGAPIVFVCPRFKTIMRELSIETGIVLVPEYVVYVITHINRTAKKVKEPQKKR